MALNGFRLMWMLVLFDLPVLTKPERKEATRFRNFLLDEGFQMSQFSVYMRFCSGKEQVDTLTRRLEKGTPRTGKVHILTLTDKQYENAVCLDGRKREPPRKNPSQLTLF